MGQGCFLKNLFEHFESICLNIWSAYEIIFTKGRLRGDKSPCRTLHFVPASRVLFSSRCTTFRVSLLSSVLHFYLGLIYFYLLTLHLGLVTSPRCLGNFTANLLRMPRVLAAEGKVWTESEETSERHCSYRKICQEKPFVRKAAALFRISLTKLNIDRMKQRLLFAFSLEPLVSLSGETSGSLPPLRWVRRLDSVWHRYRVVEAPGATHPQYRHLMCTAPGSSGRTETQTASSWSPGSRTGTETC